MQFAKMWDVGKMRQCGTEYVYSAGVKNAEICCGSTGKMQEPIEYRVRELGNQQEIEPPWGL